MNEHPKATIVVPTYNRSRFIEKAFSSLVNQDYPKDRLEIIVVDDGSADRTPEILKRFQSEYSYFRYLSQSNKGPATARNLGIRHASGEIILFIDDDCIADQNWVTELARGYQDPSVGGVAGRIKFVPSDDNIANRMAAQSNGRGQPIEPDGGIAFFITANASFKREVLDQMGGFDETFPHAVHEDVDLTHRVKQAGWKLLYSDDAVVHHYHNHTLKGNLKKWYQLGNAEALYNFKHGLRAPVWSSVPASLFMFLRVPFGFVKNVTNGLGVKQSFMFPLIHRMHDLTVSAGRVRGHLNYRRVFKTHRAVNGQTRHAVMQHLVNTQIDEHFESRTLPVYKDNAEGKLGRIAMDMERMLLTLATIRDHFEDTRRIKILELGANPYFLTALIQEHLGSDIRTNGSRLGIKTEAGEEVRCGRVSFASAGNKTVRTVENRLFNVEEDAFPYEKESFDLIICQELIEHLLFSPTFMLNEIHRVLRKGGKVIISCPNAVRVDLLRKILANKNPVWGYVRNQSRLNGADWATRHGVYGRHNREYTLGELEDLVAGCGFKVIKAECVTFDLPKLRMKSFFRTLIYRLMKSATFLPIGFFQAKKDTVFLVAEKDRDEPVAYYPQSLYDEWQVQAIDI